MTTTQPVKATKTIKTSTLTGPALDWAVAKCEGHRGVKVDLSPDLRRKLPPRIWVGSEANKPLQQGFYQPSISWTQGGPIIERERIHLCPLIFNDDRAWHAWIDGDKTWDKRMIGANPLISAMRAFVASKLGDTVDIPEELC